jgi:preprotein translocase subunit SecF
MEFFKPNTKFNFMAARRKWYVLSAVLIIASLGSLLFRGLNLGIDFTGGITVQANFSAPPDLALLEKDLVATGFAEPQVQNFGSSRDVAIRLPPAKANEKADDIRARALAAIVKLDPKAEIRSFEVVGPQVGAELRNAAILSLGATIALIFIYLVLRFHTVKLSTGAILAALHDPILVLGFFSWTWLTFDLSVVAAILAVIGYSLNDTVVVFDRIRERFEANRRSPSADIIDQSLNQTLSRTIMTSATTMIVVVVLLLRGGPVLQGFSAALVVGIIVGTYSSIYIASAVALDMGLTAENIFPSVKKNAVDELP